MSSDNIGSTIVFSTENPSSSTNIWLCTWYITIHSTRNVYENALQL
jgi:hypothetical protein